MAFCDARLVVTAFRQYGSITTFQAEAVPLNNKEGRNYFKEVWICRGQNSDVYGVEEPPECYWAMESSLLLC